MLQKKLFYRFSSVFVCTVFNTLFTCVSSVFVCTVLRFHPAFLFPVEGLKSTKNDRFVCPKNTCLKNRSFRLREMITFRTKS